MLLQISDPPTSILQDNFDPGRGNALQAAAASILGLTLDQVPNFIEMPGGYGAAISDFCQSSGMTAKKIILSSDDDENEKNLNIYEGNLCILRGKSPRGEFGHVVVARWSGSKFVMVHDPHPEGTFLDASDTYGWCMFFLSKN